MIYIKTTRKSIGFAFKFGEIFVGT